MVIDIIVPKSGLGNIYNITYYCCPVNLGEINMDFLAYNDRAYESKLR